jgi:vitamin B12 transporter
LAYTPNAGRTLIRASYTTGFKAPSLYQLLGDYGSLTLRPETSRGWDAGVTQKLIGDVLEASATYYRRISRNLIEFVGCSDNTGICFNRPFGTYDNVARARAQGVELTLTARPVKALTLSANYTYLDATDRSPGADYGDRLARRPKNTVNGNADYQWSFGLKTGATVTYASARYDGAGEVNRLHGYTLVDLRAAYPLGQHLEVYGRIQNLGDRHYETAYGYGQLGRAAYAGIRLSY